MKEQWFCYFDGNIEIFSSKEKAIEEANDIIITLGDSDMSTEDDFLSIRVGRITHDCVIAKEIQRPRKLDDDLRDENGEFWGLDWDYKLEFEMRELKSEK